MRVPLLAAALAACGTDSVSVPMVVPGEPVLVAVRSEGDAWQTVAGTFDGSHTTYQLVLADRFEVALVCVRADGTFRAGELFGTTDDATISVGSWHVPDCTEPAADVGPMVSVTGTVLETAFVAIGTRRAYVTPPQAFALPVAPGRRDLAIYGSYQLRLVHDQDITDDRDLGALSLADGASTMLTESFDVPLIADELDAVAHTALVTRNGTMLVWDTDPQKAVFVPSDQLAAGDVQTFALGAFGTTSTRTAFMTDFAQVPPSVELLPRLAPVAIRNDVVSATWTPITESFTSAAISYSDPNGEQMVTASRLWLERHATTTITFDDSVPGYLGSWHVAPAHLSFTAERWNPGVVLDTTTAQGFVTTGVAPGG